MSCRRRQARVQRPPNTRSGTLLCHYERGQPATVRAYRCRSTCRPIEPAHILQFPSAPKCIAKKTARARNYDAVRVGIKSCGLSRGSSLTLAPIMPTRTPCEGRSVVRRRKPAALWWRCALVLMHIFVILCLSDECWRRSHMAQELRKLAPKRNLPSPLICPATILVII